nr:NADH dehydrogenase subunit 5 [Craspedonirmus immer]
MSNKKFVHFFCMVFVAFSFTVLMLVSILESPIYVEWGVVGGALPIELSLSFQFDKLSMVFFLTVSLISTVVTMYSYEYMKNDKGFNKFILVLFMFILSMLCLTLSSSMFWVMIGWDGLGISSFGLIMFYRNWKSFNSALYTMVMNRLGDVALIMLIWWALFYTDSFRFFSSGDSEVAAILLFLVGSTKSAQIPFSFWLPLAMSAPTPVSALVHSSTLVTAGIYLFIRFGEFVFTPLVQLSMLIVSSSTILLASTSALYECDFKKIIALSTLSHLGLIVLFISLGASDIALIHLVCHAIFKSMIFMIAGAIIHSNNDVQDIRRILSPTGLSPIICMSLLSSFGGMVGLPFLSGFYSKDLLILSIQSLTDSWWGVMVMFLSASSTVAYSTRVVSLVMKGWLGDEPPLPSPPEGGEMEKVLLVGTLISVAGGSWTIWLMSELETNVDYGLASPALKLSLLGALVLGVMVGSNPPRSMQGSLEQFFSTMWFMNYPFLVIQKIYFKSVNYSLVELDKKGFISFLTSSSMSKLMSEMLQTLNGSPSSSFLTGVKLVLLYSVFLTFLLSVAL